MTHGPYLIWSAACGTWWGREKGSYTADLSQAGRYSRDDAISICATSRDGWASIPALGINGYPRHGEIPVREADALECAQIYASITSSTHG